MTSAIGAYHHNAQIHPKKYFECSPTWDVWNKLSAHDVYGLREERGFEGQRVYFALNNPIRYIYLCGLVQQFDLAPGAGAAKYALLTLDDGSGRVIEVKIERRQVAAGDNAQYPSTTLLDNVNVHVQMGLPTLLIDGKVVGVGAVVKVKGTVAIFRQQRQVELKRIFIVNDTNDEVAFWAALAKHRSEILGRVWMLSGEQRAEVDIRLLEEQKRVQGRARKKKEWEARNDEKRARREEKAEAIRVRVEEQLNAGALVGSHVVKAPWE